MRVALINPPVPAGAFTNRDLMGGMGIDDGFGTGAGPRFIALLKNEGTRLPVLSLAYGAAVLRAAGHDVVVLDQLRRPLGARETVDEVVRARPDHIVAATSYAYLGSELRYLAGLREATGAPRLLLGAAATHFASEILEHGHAEAVASGDPEVALAKLADGTLAPGHDGVLMRGADGRMVQAPASFLADLDALPRPAWDALPLHEYGYFPLLKRRPFATMLTSRGCPYVCRFCPYPVAQGDRFRARNPLAVAAEMEWLAAQHGVRSVLLRDPNFSFDMERVKVLCRRLVERGNRVEWGIETRLDRLDEEMVELLAQAGCRSAEFGLDPLDPEVLRASNRKAVGTGRAWTLVRALERAGIRTAGLFVLGLPGQDAGDLDRSLDWIESLGLSYVNYELATAFPGTALRAEAVERGWMQAPRLQDLLDGDPKLRFNGVLDLPRLRAFQDAALRRFYLRPGRLARELASGDLGESVRFLAGCGWKFLRKGAA